jgi:hypothetical protein
MNLRRQGKTFYRKSPLKCGRKHTFRTASEVAFFYACSGYTPWRSQACRAMLLPMHKKTRLAEIVGQSPAACLLADIPVARGQNF